MGLELVVDCDGEDGLDVAVEDVDEFDPAGGVSFCVPEPRQG